MKNKLSQEKLFAYIFNELSEAENNRIEDLIVEDEVFAVEVSNLIQSCRTNNIKSSKELTQYLELEQHRFFHKKIQQGVQLPDFLKEKFEKPPSENQPIASIKNQIENIPEPINRSYGKWILAAFALIAIFSILIFQCPNNEKKDTEADTINQQDPNQEERKEQIIASNISEKVYQTWERDLPQTKNQIIENSKIRGNIPINVYQNYIDSLIQVEQLNLKISDSEYMKVGVYYFSKRENQNAAKFFEKVENDRREVDRNWYLLYTYIAQQNETALEKAKQIFKEKFIQNESMLPINESRVEQMSIELKDLLIPEE